MPNPKKPKIAFAHLGCDKNRVDTEHMIGLLAAAGYGVGTDETEADYVIVNTCSFIQAAREESVRTLVELAEANKKIVITGCLAQHFQGELLAELPEAVAVVGSGDYQHIVEVIERVERGERVQQISAVPTYIADETVPRYRTTPAPVAYLRIAEGCDYRCAFCIIPHLRGNQRSRSLESIVSEAHQLAAEGVQEIIIVSQITTNYGLDRYGQPQLATLIRALGEVDVPWIRLHYAYPTGLTPEVIAAMRETPNILPYLDLPLQHSHPEVLRAMNRPWQAGVNDRLIERLRQELPEAVVRTTFIVGFPGETESQFEHLCQFVQRHEFDHVGVFTYSPEEGTAAYDLPHQIPEEIKRARRDRLMELQQPIAQRKNAAEVGKIVPVLIEQENPQTGEFIGRSPRFAPEVDGVVYVKGAATLGTIVPVEITAADIYDLYGIIPASVRFYP
ncbi:30S ribosomal protein S12 methylthiotransferase RimO [Thermosynechococcus vestitus]|uniref:Ribosomal protein uS12 methylthiotransferase RimO n=1 Tax=Thermosynechococcus vestitus (strain NIES-2133 / IAM M-273 / BP-1) TaxID=197221 RepID=RIMO_THEVB|nr:30S ribosomal protein S12 methylthiotransferase RimO [Thermosynechococcus vestitus]Q8DIL8.1 RecName: Full=Ribosomal protein uS12 methylthiotransferase RimO; Short=uS12 MTTase; Short=uS12 methylthiotransferase; AltName: Full=Ribosomal protein uS12 (aspartate-C(3))-methylthiotransferase; AltName: Full=Ribosome maturation factor RimO [Thermosynechococcus vestitus BP-1]BAC09116.1 tlr1564 [Thermosynechococcus vestitus BP-1]